MRDSEDSVDEEIDYIASSQNEQMVPLLTALSKRCKDHQIEFTEETEEDGEVYGRMRLGAGKLKRSVYIWHPRSAARLLAIAFEKYGFIAKSPEFLKILFFATAKMSR